MRPTRDEDALSAFKGMVRGVVWAIPLWLIVVIVAAYFLG